MSWQKFVITYTALWILLVVINGVLSASDPASEARKRHHPYIDSLFDSLALNIYQRRS